MIIAALLYFVALWWLLGNNNMASGTEGRPSEGEARPSEWGGEMAFRKRRDRKKSSKGRQQSTQIKTIVQNFPFLNDDKTIGHIRFSKVLFLMRGLPGSGKSTLVGLLKTKYRRAVVCSADDFFLDDRGVYTFDPRRIGEAHERCKQRASNACESGKNVVIVDNTNVKRWEMGHYLKVAAINGYTVIIVIPQTPWRTDPMELSKRNKHGVPLETLEKKVREFQTVNPLYWAWFLSERDSTYLRSLGCKFFNECIKCFTKFGRCIRESLDLPDDARLDFDNIYGQRRGCETAFHCTAYFCEAGPKSAEANEYAARDIVRRSAGQSFGIHVIGFVITPRTIGARLALNGRQMRLWNQNDNPPTASGGSREPAPSLADDLARMSINDKRTPNTSSTSKSSPAACVESPDALPQDPHESLGSRPRFRPIVGAGSRAHITIGFSSGHAPVETGFDLVRIVELEQSTGSKVQQVDVDKDVIRYYEEGQCVVYLDRPIQIPALFSGKY